MKIVYDARTVAQPYSGLARYTGSLLRALVQTHTTPGLRVQILLQAGMDPTENFHLSWLATDPRSTCCSVHFIDAPAISLKQHRAVSAWVNRSGADLYFYPHFDLPIGIAVPAVYVVHDVIPLIVHDYVQRFAAAKRYYFKLMLRRGVRRASRCIAVSATTKADIVRIVGPKHADKIKVVYEGPVIQSPCSSGVDRKLAAIEPYLLYVGDRRPHKNLRRMLQIFLELKVRWGYPGRMIFVGSTQNYDFDLDAFVAASPVLRGAVRIMGNVTDEQLAQLYQKADALLFLSEYEGFGLPVVEATRFSTRVIISDGGALPEIAPDDALIVPRGKGVEAAALLISQYLSLGRAASPYALDDRFQWDTAAREIFPCAYE